WTRWSTACSPGVAPPRRPASALPARFRNIRVVASGKPRTSRSRSASEQEEHIPLARPVLGQAEERAAIEVLRSGRLSLGPRTEQFERAFAARVGAAYASAVSSGTGGLHLALRAAGVSAGDEVVTSPFSFVASAEAGTSGHDEAALKRRIDSERNQGRAADMGWLEHDRMVFNYRLAEGSGAIGSVQRERLEEMLAARDWLARWYREALSVIEGVELPCADADGNTRGWFVFVVQLPRDADRDETVRALAAAGIESKPYLPAIHLLSYYRERFGHSPGEFPVCEDV